MMIINRLLRPVLVFFLLQAPCMALAQNLFLGRISPEKGVVEVRNHQGEWNRIDHSYYLVNGIAIRTQENSTALVEISGVDYASTLAPDSEVSVENNLIELVRGEFLSNRILASNFISKFQEKLEGAYSYITQRRQAPCQPVIRTARILTLSPMHPDLVWQNACPRYTYRLVIDDEIYEISDTEDKEIISFTVANVGLGIHTYRVEILENDRVIYAPASDSIFEWTDSTESEQIALQIASLGNDVFAQTDLLEDKGFLVAAMYLYRDYFQSHSEENHLRPLLIKAYAVLGLYNLQSEEVRLYNSLRDI